MKKNIQPFSLRLSEKIRSWYEKEAEQNGRSLNSEISRTLDLNMKATEERRKK